MRGSSDNAAAWLEEQARTLHSEQPQRVEVFLRSLAPPIGVRERQEALLERLRAFERRGLIESIDITVWGDAVCPDGCCTETVPGRDFLGRVNEMRRWARNAEADVEVPFEEKQVISSITDEQFRKIVLPRIAIGVHTDGDLEPVFPCRVSDESVSVRSFLDSCERDTTAERGIGTSA